MNSTTGQRLLIIDDQPANLQVLGSVLGSLGYEIIPAGDGPTALRRLNLRPPDLVLLDLLMPGMDGFEVCRRIRQQVEFAEMPIIFLSAADEKELVVRALEAGGVDYITKPFNQAELVRRVQTHLALKAARDNLKRLAEDKEELLGILAHDLKNHVGGMHMTAQILRDRVPASEARLREMAANLATASGQTLIFLREFLANAASDHGFSLAPCSIDLNTVVTQAAAAYSETARQKEQKIQVNAGPDPLTVTADPGALRQIIDNLISNAIKFSPPKRSIQISTSAVDGTARLEVEDSGPGLTPADRERLFRRYTRLSARPTAGEPSTGLGLSIVRRLVEAMNGEVACETGALGGARFVVRLGLAAASH